MGHLRRMTEHSPLSSYPVRLPIRVAWGEMDAFAHLNNTVYFRYFESARIAYFEGMEILTKAGGVAGVGPILRQHLVPLPRAGHLSRTSSRSARASASSAATASPWSMRSGARSCERMAATVRA